MNTKEMLNVALQRGPCCFLTECKTPPATYRFYDNVNKRYLYLCDEHTYVTHNREQLPDADQVREIMDFIRQED